MDIQVPKKAYIVPLLKFIFLFEFILLLKKFFTVIKAYKHPILSCLYIISHFKKEFIISYKDGTSVSVNSIRAFYSLALRKNSSILQTKINTFKYNGLEIKLYCADPVGSQIEVFQEDEYKFLEVNGKNVIDVGANIGDTAIYFLLKSASKVIAVEPYPANCNIIEKNVNNNSIDKNKIVILNAGIGLASKTKIPYDIINSGASEGIYSENGKEIDIIPLSVLIYRYGFTNVVLKMDCEGCEYDALLNESCENLRFFNQMQIEYHYGPWLLVQKLSSCGFTVSYSSPKFIPNINVRDYMTLRGYIYATRN